MLRAETEYGWTVVHMINTDLGTKKTFICCSVSTVLQPDIDVNYVLRIYGLSMFIFGPEIFSLVSINVRPNPFSQGFVGDCGDDPQPPLSSSEVFFEDFLSSLQKDHNVFIQL